MRNAFKTIDEIDAGVCLPVPFGNGVLILDPAGVAILSDEATLLVADLHLEKGSSMARRGQLVPPYDTMATLERLAILVEKHNPKTVITLGDNFHDPEASERLSEKAIDAIGAMASGRQWIWMTGNHDPQPPRSVAGDGASEIAIAGITLRHIADPSYDGLEISGHLHPAAKIRVRGKAVRRPCFVSDGTRMILPSFGVYTGGLNVRSPAFDGLFRAQSLCAYMLGIDRVYPMAGSSLIT